VRVGMEAGVGEKVGREAFYGVWVVSRSVDFRTSMTLSAAYTHEEICASFFAVTGKRKNRIRKVVSRLTS